MDDQRDIANTLARHQRRRWLRWQCHCGRRWARCSPRREAEAQRVALECRSRLDLAIAAMRTHHSPTEAHR